MMLASLLSLLAIWCLSAGTLAKAITPSRTVPSRRQETPIDPAQPQATDCYDIIAYGEQGARLFWASEVFDCLKNVPFNPAVAERFINYYNQTLQFQSTLSVLANPPPSYQQPAVDVLLGLQNIKANISAGYYQNQYVFEADVQLLINQMHDGHVSLNAGSLSPFTFVSPYGLVSASEDGKSAPKIFLVDDIIDFRFEDWRPSSVEKINGVDVVEYLTRFGELNSDGYLEPHADWNAMMDSPVQDIQGGLSIFQRAMFYPGDGLNFTFANGSSLETFWWALYNENDYTGPLTTAGDFYNYFVLGFIPADFNISNPTAWWSADKNLPQSSDTDTNTTTNTTTPSYGCSNGNPHNVSWCQDSYGAYPNDPIVVQEDLGFTGAGIVSGYILNDSSTGVLSIPSFYQTGNDTINFADAVSEFIEKTQAQNVSRVVIDLQQNSGGKILLALTTFKQFFYGLQPYTGSRIRSQRLANILGTAYTEWWDSLEQTPDDADSLYDVYAGREWVVTNRINPVTGQNFTSWDEYSRQEPGSANTFSQRQLYNLSDEAFDFSIFGFVPNAYVQPTDPTVPTQIWSPEDIVILTDGLCGSACAMFVELMTHQAGVRTISIGGRPVAGPMQAASGTRGASIYTADALDYDYQQLNDTLQDVEAYAQWPQRDDTGMWINYASFNIRDQMRENNDTPLQFQYNAAQCRIYYTLDNIYNMTRLWRDAAAATWDDKSLCVEDSTGYAPGPNNTESKSPPSRKAQSPTLDTEAINKVAFQVNSTGGLDGILLKQNSIPTSDSKTLIKCDAVTPCKAPLKCQPVVASCPQGGWVWKEYQPSFCLPPCSLGGRKTCDCQTDRRADTKSNVPFGRATATTTGRGITNRADGFCLPVNGQVRGELFPISQKACAAGFANRSP